MEQNKMTHEFFKTLPWRIASQKWLNCFYHINGKDENRELKILSLNDGPHPSKAHRDRIRDNANAIVSAINGTYGVRVNPEAVADLRHALNSLILSVKAHPDYTGEENEEWTDLVEIAEDAMKKAAL